MKRTKLGISFLIVSLVGALSLWLSSFSGWHESNFIHYFGLWVMAIALGFLGLALTLSTEVFAPEIVEQDYE